MLGVTYYLKRNLQLKHHNIRFRRHQLPVLTRLARKDVISISSKQDPVLSAAFIHNDIRHSSLLTLQLPYTAHIDPLLPQPVEVVSPENVISHVPDHGHLDIFGSEPCTCYGLVGAFASEAGREGVRRKRFAWLGKAWSPGYEVDV